jgi:hypothetical protein
VGAAEQAGDLAAQAWVRHELGSLYLCAGDPEAATERLRQARQLQQRLGQATGTCATRHNLESAERDIATTTAMEPWSRRLLRLAGVVGVITLVVVGGTVMALAQGGETADPPPTTGPITSGSTSTAPVPGSTTTETSDATTTSTTGTTTLVDNTAPVVALVTPGAGSANATRSPKFSGTAGVEAGDGAEVLVEIVDENGRPLAASPLRAPVVAGAWTATPTSALLDGSYQATATQRDGEGNTGRSATVTFTIDTRAPVLMLACDPEFVSLTITCTLTSTEAGTASFELTEIRFRSEEEAEFRLPTTIADETVALEPGRKSPPFVLTLPPDDFDDGRLSVRWAFEIVAVQFDAARNSDRSDPERTERRDITTPVP